MTAQAAILRAALRPRGTGQAATETANLPTISLWLALLVFVTILPVLAFSGFMIVNYAQAQRALYEQQMRATAHVISLAVDAELSRRLAILMTLRNSRELKDRDWRAFYDLATAAIADQPNSWINLYEPEGQFVFSTLTPYGTALPQSADLEIIRRVVETRQPYVSDLLAGAFTGQPSVKVYVPVIENGAVHHVLNLAAPPYFISRILQNHVQISGWGAAEVDRNGLVVARSTNEEKFAGHLAMPEYLKATHDFDEGSAEFHNFDGKMVRSIFTKSVLSGWSTSVAVEKSSLDAPLWHSLGIFGSGCGLLCAVALLLASYYGRGFAKPVATLAAMAQSFGAGNRLLPKDLGLREMQIIGDQMVLAAETLHQNFDERANLLARLNDSNQRLGTANKELETFAYSVSHDLRAPLRAIDGFSRMLQEDCADNLDAEARRLIQVVRDGVGKMGRLIDDILAFSRASRSEMATSDIDMTELVRATLAELAPAMTGRHIEVIVAPLPPTRGDREMMQRVWMNLLDNAIKFTTRKENPRIEVGSYPEANETVYFVKDNGAGFDMAYIDKLFSVFQRLHTVEDFPGTGAGLAIVKRIVNRHGGRVWAEGEVDKGAAFYFALGSRTQAHV